MAYTKTEWKPRRGDGLNRFYKSQETDRSVMLTNNPTSIIEEGTPFDPPHMNKIEQGVYDAHELVAAETLARARDGGELRQMINALDMKPSSGAVIKRFNVSIGRGPRVIPFSALGLDPDREYAFIAGSKTRSAFLREIVAVREGNSVYIYAHYDTSPYTLPQTGAPAQVISIGAAGNKIGVFKIGQMFPASFAVSLLCFEISPAMTLRKKIGAPALTIGAFKVGQEQLL